MQVLIFKNYFEVPIVINKKIAMSFLKFKDAFTSFLDRKFLNPYFLLFGKRNKKLNYSSTMNSRSIAIRFCLV